MDLQGYGLTNNALVLACLGSLIGLAAPSVGPVPLVVGVDGFLAGVFQLDLVRLKFTRQTAKKPVET